MHEARIQRGRRFGVAHEDDVLQVARGLLANVRADLLRTERAGDKCKTVTLRRTMRDPRRSASR